MVFKMFHAWMVTSIADFSLQKITKKFEMLLDARWPVYQADALT